MVIRRCDIFGNSASNDGGGIRYDEGASGAIEISQTVIRGNHAGGSGGGIAGKVFVTATAGFSPCDDCTSSALTISLHDSQIYRNTSDGKGGGAAFGICAKPDVVNTSFSDNYSDTVGGAIYGSTSCLLIADSILWGDTQATAGAGYEVALDSLTEATARYSDIQGGLNDVLGQSLLTWGAGNQDVDPGFCDPDSDDYHLASTSPVRDDGLNADVVGSYDIDGDTRILNTTVDLGADEFKACSTSGDCDDEDICNGAETCSCGTCHPGVITDCNGNRVADICDITDDTSEDCNANGVPDECESGVLNALIASDPVGSEPGEDPASDLWRRQNNVVRLTFACDITGPGSGDVLIREMEAGTGDCDPPSYGSDVSSAFTFTVENNGNNDPRILRIDGESSSTLDHRSWYEFANEGDWDDMAEFALQYPV